MIPTFQKSRIFNKQASSFLIILRSPAIAIEGHGMVDDVVAGVENTTVVVEPSQPLTVMVELGYQMGDELMAILRHYVALLNAIGSYS